MHTWLALAAMAGGGQAEPPRLDCTDLQIIVAAAHMPTPFADFPRGPEGRWPLLGLGGSCARGLSDDGRLYCGLHRRGGLTSSDVLDQAVGCLAGPEQPAPRFHVQDGALRGGDVWLLVRTTNPQSRLGYQVILWIGRGDPPPH